MDYKKELAILEDVLDMESGTLMPETKLKDLNEWNSIAALSIIIMLDEKYGREITGEQVRTLVSVRDILTYMR